MGKEVEDENPEVFWCSYCGRKMWAIAKHIISPEQLKCDECKQYGVKKEKENGIL